MMKLEGVKPPEFTARLFKKSYNTGDIINVVNRVIASDHADVKEFAAQFPPTREGLKMLFDYAHQYFRYKEDPAGSQFVQTPSYFYHVSKVADCKTFTAFLAPVIFYMGLKVEVLYAAYSTFTVKHVYPVAYLKGERIPMDLVYLKEQPSRGGFGIEKKFTKKITYKVQGVELKGNGLYKIGNTEKPMTINEHLRMLDDLAAQIPDEVVYSGPGDLMLMNEGQLNRFLVAEQLDAIAKTTSNQNHRNQLMGGASAVRMNSIAGIGAMTDTPLTRQLTTVLRKAEKQTAPAFSPIGELQFDLGDSPEIAGLFKKIGKGIKKVGKKIGNGIKDVGKKIIAVHKKIINAIFKLDAKKMGSYFMFLMIPSPSFHLIKGAVKKRRDNQKKSLKRISKFMGVKEDKMLTQMYTGVTQQFGKTPEQLISDAEKNVISGTASVGAFPALAMAAIKAIGIIIKVIKQLKSLFKKKASNDEMGNVGEENMSDMGVLEAEARAIGKDKLEKLKKNPDKVESGGGTGLALAAAAAGAFVFFG